METKFYQQLTEKALSHPACFDEELCRKILQDKEIDVLSLVHAAYQLRKQFFGREVMVHVINNVQNGFCPEDCHYCAQAKTSKANIEEYPLKPDHEILAEAKRAYESGAYRYCMVFAGRGPSEKRVEKLAQLIQKIKQEFPIEICISAGLLDAPKAKILKEAGLDRLNHNLNTSEDHYPKICTTHTYQDRMNTLAAAKQAGLQLCSGVIVGMGESVGDLLDVAFSLAKMNVESIPVNFLVPIEGSALQNESEMTPEFCLRVLCLFRFLSPRAEIRVAAGRELRLRELEVLALYPANSLFLEGYLNTRGAKTSATLRMIQDAGFSVKSNCDLSELLKPEVKKPGQQGTRSNLKSLDELRPYLFTPQ